MAKITEDKLKTRVKIGNLRESNLSNLTPANEPNKIITSMVIPMPEYFA